MLSPVLCVCGGGGSSSGAIDNEEETSSDGGREACTGERNGKGPRAIVSASGAAVASSHAAKWRTRTCRIRANTHVSGTSNAGQGGRSKPHNRIKRGQEGPQQRQRRGVCKWQRNDRRVRLVGNGEGWRQGDWPTRESVVQAGAGGKGRGGRRRRGHIGGARSSSSSSSACLLVWGRGTKGGERRRGLKCVSSGSVAGSPALNVPPAPPPHPSR